MVPSFSFLIARSSFTRYYTTHIQLGFLLQHKHKASLVFFNSFISGRNHHKDDTFTVSYLINSCGVSPTLAKELSKRVNLKNQDGPNAVLDILKNHGFDKTQVAKLVEKHPLVLVAKVEKTLLPKLKFLRSIGVSNAQMPKILLRNYVILTSSLKNCLIPRYEILRGIIQDDQNLVRILKNSTFNLTYGDSMNHLVPNVKVLRQCCVPQASITLMMVHFPSTVSMKHSKFVEAVKTAKGIGFDPLKVTFIKAVQVLLTTSKALWHSKFEVYERWGWNQEIALQAFAKFPDFMKLSKETYTKKMSYLVKDVGLPAQDIAEYPQVLVYSLEKRIIPRFSVVKILQSKGLLKKDLHFSSFMCLSEENFLKKFVINFQDDKALLLNVYKGLINH